MRQWLDLIDTGPRKPVEYLPFNFARLADSRVLLTNMVGEHLFVSSEEFDAIGRKDFASPDLLRRLRARHLVREVDEPLPVSLLALKFRTQHAHLPEFTGLHIFVVTLRCEHSCRYCQVSRQSVSKTDFDMSHSTADAALQMAFRSPARHLKIEFQGGEPLLNFDLVRHITQQARKLADESGRSVEFVIASNLALLNNEVLHFAKEHDVHFSTSLDGPADLHNRNRPRPGADSWERTVAGISAIRESLGHDRVSALMTSTAATLPRVRDVIDTYVELGFRDIFLRTLSPYGHATRLQKRIGYAVDVWTRFYLDGLDYILELNRSGVPLRETFASIVLTKMLTNRNPGYVDLTSPAGIGLGALVYNYDGGVYASDEGRMLAEMGDETFRLGTLGVDSYEAMLTGDRLLDPLEQSFTLSAPMCTDCAFERFCGADPVFHHTVSGDYVGKKAFSDFCHRNMAIFTRLLELYEDDTDARHILQDWVAQ